MSLAFGLAGYFQQRFEFLCVTFIIGFIIGPHLELAVRRFRIIPKGGSIREHPVAVGFLVLTNLVFGRISLATRSRLWG